MQEIQIPIINKLGLHARAASKFVTTSTAFASRIQVSAGQQWVDGKSIMSVMMLAASKGMTLHIRCEGEDEQAALDALVDLIERRFDEGE
ncbi:MULTISPECIES: HPr family phosphocarrier protein [Spongiibacter]|jgi:phosphocarrier protein|uniref:HPr family phosphocarrier protein n=1 Tax=Spongiibacter TaxID=630749 RepID=UPI0004065607|nr:MULTISPECIES: HPr family phosphocarrier protein [Spongiibacter]MAK44780.1 HPr family phosphocarrier protein [Spongiibacter sp.]MBM7424740.1 phosphocarrier protein [Spongiibacter marinus]MEE2651097.1 HPr family phosphocarrier protein [Pseudomonadota bacterium]|tara:strand:- start:862 stop:1131 length:270 start_codon:yes stop_codon:yes gene_type:complete